ncbi:hypothetical protein E2C01_070328 [Portunus trituberculatus]|uniref:Uncharacterized protein n=1 Tax=Portunus trituberculatus TaxID=210409 RepID=A0A5B7I4U2_PORTR|nr:hypothetical protein [Portunus trituberculatus]
MRNIVPRGFGERQQRRRQRQRWPAAGSTCASCSFQGRAGRDTQVPALIHNTAAHKTKHNRQNKTPRHTLQNTRANKKRV